MSGVPPGKIEDIIKHDFKHLAYNKRVFDSPSYLREKGKPVVALWGINLFSFPLPRMTANTNTGFFFARFRVRRLSPYARSRSFNRFLHKPLPSRRRIFDGRRSVACPKHISLSVLEKRERPLTPCNSTSSCALANLYGRRGPEPWFRRRLARLLRCHFALDDREVRQYHRRG